MTTSIPSSERLRCIDWRTLPADRIAPLYAAEISRWATTLDWETAANWADVEFGRQRGALSGIVLLDEREAVVGWSYYLVCNCALQIGSFFAPSLAAAEVMIDAILTERILSTVESVTFFAFTDIPGLGPALRLRGLSVDQYRYLGRDTQRVAAPRLDDVRQWRPDDMRATAELLSRSYPSIDEARPFVPGGGSTEWTEYVGQLTGGRGCGVLLPEACLTISGGSNQLLAVALVTRLAGNTGHLAQLAVDPREQGRHLGRRLLDMACASAAQAGCGRVTLFVGARNHRARSLYETSRFEMMASFLSAGTLHPRRPTSFAPRRALITRQ